MNCVGYFIYVIRTKDKTYKKKELFAVLLMVMVGSSEGSLPAAFPTRKFRITVHFHMLLHIPLRFKTLSAKRAGNVLWVVARCTMGSGIRLSAEPLPTDGTKKVFFPGVHGQVVFKISFCHEPLATRATDESMLPSMASNVMPHGRFSLQGFGTVVLRAVVHDAFMCPLSVLGEAVLVPERLQTTITLMLNAIMLVADMPCQGRFPGEDGFTVEARKRVGVGIGVSVGVGVGGVGVGVVVGVGGVGVGVGGVGVGWR